MTLEQLIATAKSKVAGAKENLAKFGANLEEHPESTLNRWGSRMFADTATVVVWTEVLNDAEAGAEPEALQSSLERHIFYAATNPPHSSSQLDNYLSVEKTRERAEALKYIQRLVRVAPAQPANTAA
jgi:hypothetical protein